MDCAHCDNLLLDLCYGELSAAQEREVRAHVADCTSCRQALAKLEAGRVLASQLPIEPPSPELIMRITKAAQAHAQRGRGPLTLAWATSFGSFGMVQGWLETMAKLAMTRQVAMATLSLLIVFVGLWSIPELTRRRDKRGEVVVEAPTEGEAAPSAALAEPQSAAAPAAPSPVAPAAALAERRERRPSQPAKPERARLPARRDAAKAKGEIANLPARSGRRGSGRAEADEASDLPLAAESSLDRRIGQAPRFATPPPPAAEAEAKLEPSDTLTGLEDGPNQRLGGGTATAAKPARTAAAAPSKADAAERTGAPDSVPAAEAAPVQLEQLFAAGVERYRVQDYTAAAQLFSRMLASSAPSGQRAAALLYLARSERALDRCDRAIRAYETLVRSYGSAQQSASALSEGVECYDRLGETNHANALLQHATSVPSLSAQATKALQLRGVIP